jgi:conjugative transfer region protein TrbK
MRTSTIARAGAIAFVGVAITIGMIEARQAPALDRDVDAGPVAAATADPLREALTRCQAIGQAGAADAACLRIWAENRRRFLTPRSRSAEHGSAVTQSGPAGGNAPTAAHGIVRVGVPSAAEER